MYCYSRQDFRRGAFPEIAGKYREIIDCMNQAEACKVAVDIPSGIHGDTGAILGVAFKADMTVTFAYRKRGLCLYPGRMYAGKVVTAEHWNFTTGTRKASRLQKKQPVTWSRQTWQSFL
ncbi:MAG: NAD(P)H-hydrate epimerase [Ruminococcus sp.]